MDIGKIIEADTMAVCCRFGFAEELCLRFGGIFMRQIRQINAAAK
jgi:hypothetical protein